MKLSATTIEVIRNLVAAKGLTEEELDELTGSLTGLDITSQKSSSLATQIYRQSRLEPSFFQLSQPEEAIYWIDNFVLPDIIEFLDNEIKSVTLPFEFPPPEEALIPAYPDSTSSTRVVYITSWQRQLKQIARWYALSEILLSVDDTDKEYRDISNEYRRRAEDGLAKIKASITGVLSINPKTAEINGSMSLISIKLPSDTKRRSYDVNETGLAD